MKIKAFFAVALAAAVTLSSCSKENDGNLADKTSANRVLVTIKKAETGRAVSTNSVNTPLTLEGGKIIFSNLNGKISKVVNVIANAATPGDDDVKIGDLETGAVIEEVMEDTKKVTFIGAHTAANPALPATLVDANISAVYAAAFSIAQIADDGTTVVSNVPIFGEDSSLTLDSTDPEAPVLEADFTVKAIGSRIQISGVKGDPASVKSFKVAGIWINNYLPSMTYAQSPLATAVVNNGSAPANYVDKATYSAPVLSDYDAAGLGTSVSACEYVAGTDKYWAYNVFPNKGLGSEYLPHVVIRLTDLIDINDGDHGTKYITVKGYTGTTKGEIAEFEGGYSYTFGDGLEFKIDDVTEKPETEAITGKVTIEAIAWKDELVTPKY